MLDYFERYRSHDLPTLLKDEIVDVDGNPVSLIDRLNRINIFLGSNNAGKSKLLRELLKSGSKSYYGLNHWETIQRDILPFFEEIISTMSSIVNPKSLYSLKNLADVVYVDLGYVNNAYTAYGKFSPDYSLANIKKSLANIFSADFISVPQGTLVLDMPSGNKTRMSMDDSRGKAAIQLIMSAMQRMKTQRLPSILQKCDDLMQTPADRYLNRIYIPSIRTLRPFAVNAKLVENTQTEYGFNSQVTVANGEGLPGEIDEMRNTEWKEQEKLEDFENLLSTYFFDCQKVRLRYHKKKRILNIKIGTEMDRPIFELGDGLQMIVILTYPFFRYEGGTIVIEEPELFIHPGLQKAFVRFLIAHSKTKNWQIFLATHSNHIVDAINMSNEVSLFGVSKRYKPGDSSNEKVPNFCVENLAIGNENLLNLLGITTSSVYLSNCTIWVEGITDKIYIQKFIEVFLENESLDPQFQKCRNFKEGINYSFALTGGDSIIHWDFSDDSEYAENLNKIIVRQFCSKSYVIVDNDFGKNPKRKELLAKCMGTRFDELKVPEVENLLGQSVIKSTIQCYPSVKRETEGGIQKELSQQELQENKIGTLIDTILLKEYPSTKKFSAENGSIRHCDKYDFCLKATQFITHTNLTSDAEELVKRILNFVMLKNG